MTFKSLFLLSHTMITVTLNQLIPPFSRVSLWILFTQKMFWEPEEPSSPRHYFLSRLFALHHEQLKIETQWSLPFREHKWTSLDMKRQRNQ